MNVPQVVLLLDLADGVTIGSARFAITEEQIGLIGLGGIEYAVGGDVEDWVFCEIVF